MQTDAILGQWRKLSGLPGGKRLFSILLGRVVPYSGSIGARVEQLEPGFTRVRLAERHLRSVHAVALTNLGELSSGLAMLSGLPPGMRGIVVRLTTEYFEKARGVLTAECRCDVEGSSEERELDVRASIKNAEGREVARVTARWKVGPAPARTSPQPA
jgi:acyl-coenzyme A thioesterase PaaI-like protein